jgi:hypothetical protein
MLTITLTAAPTGSASTSGMPLVISQPAGRVILARWGRRLPTQPPLRYRCNSIAVTASQNN